MKKPEFNELARALVLNRLGRQEPQNYWRFFRIPGPNGRLHGLEAAPQKAVFPASALSGRGTITCENGKPHTGPHPLGAGIYVTSVF